MTKLKSSKWVFITKFFCGTRKTHNEKKSNSDPEIEQFIRPKRRAKNLPDSWTDTKWLKKINDKSWKNRSKSRNQYDKHSQTIKEKIYCLKDKEEVKNIIRKFGKKIKKIDYWELIHLTKCFDMAKKAILEMEKDNELSLIREEIVFYDFSTPIKKTIIRYVVFN